MTEKFLASLQAAQSRFSGTIQWDEPLARHTYYRIGGPAKILAVPRRLDDLKLLSELLRESGVPVFILGAGSNLLVSDQGFDGLVIKTGRLNSEIVRETRLRTGTSVMISSLLRRAAQEGWGGLHFLTGIPGTAGGVVFMNGGTHLGEAKERARRVEAYSLEEGTLVAFEGERLKFEYRRNLFLPRNAIVWAVEWEISSEDPRTVKSAIDETLARRKATQPIDYPSCGSVFKNPKNHGVSAWQIVDRLGLRGHRIGDAQVSEKHSNFIINLGNAKAQDVRALIDLIKSRAKAELGIPLEEEVKCLGFDQS